MFWPGLFKRIAILSLLAGVSLSVLWVRSYFVRDMLVYESIGGRVYGVISNRGRIAAGSERSTFRAGFRYKTEQAGKDLGRTNSILGFGWISDKSGTAGTRVVVMPQGFLTPLAFVPAVLWLRHRRRNRPKPGHCVACGYDLRASPDRCPECGARSVTPAPAPARPC